MNDLITFGFLFETLCIRDLRVFADALNGEVYHYRDKDGQECDAVVHLKNGKYGLIECISSSRWRLCCSYRLLKKLIQKNRI